jgi:DNA-binding transcriptional regulator GbsR (MarR family)
MKRRLLLFSALAAAVFFLAQMNCRADSELSSDRLDTLDQWGCFTPAFKAAVHDLVDAKQGIVSAKKQETELSQKLPDLQKQATEAEAKTAALQKELDRYEHADENDFAELQKKMNEPGAKPEDQRVLAQAYVWTYPTSPHLAEAQRSLQQVEKTISDQALAETNAEAAQAAARANLIERVKARQLSLAEWRDFLRDMSQEDLLKYLGQPENVNGDYWVYPGEWTEDPVTHQKVGLQINFNAARVISVSEALPAP